MIELKSKLVKLTIDGQQEELPDREPTLKELQDCVGGYIEVVRLDASTIMVVDEEGLLKGKSINRVASAVSGRRIVGDVVIMPDSYLK